MHTDSGMTGISLSGYMPYMTVASLEMSDEPFILIVSSFCSTLSAQTYKTYRIAYVLTPYGNYDPENAFITIADGQIRYKKNGSEKHWLSMYRGIYKEQPTKGVIFQYECFQLMKLDKMIRISKTKNVKHNGKFYYAMYVDGQLQLAE